MEKKIRKDINGLRALAVLSVLLFHFNPSFIPGGFVGVDVFFVISGFLMTSIIFRGMESNSFNFISFLKTRAIRIIPALLVTIVITLLAGFIFIEPLSYKIIGEHASSSLLFVSNILYWSESGYFDLDAYNKFLLHTWSLSVEWQFYIIYPLILIVLKRYFTLNIIKNLVVLLTIIFFIISIILSVYQPTFSYFMLPSRAWELMAGGLAYLYPITINNRYKKYIETIGVILIVFSFIKINTHDSWPGYLALLPVIGTFLCLCANNEKSILSFSVLQKIGLWSYSIYLTHWPIIVFFKKLSISLPFYLYIIGVLIASFALYELIEKRRNYSIKLLYAYFLTLLIAVLVCINGMAWRLPEPNYGLDMKTFKELYAGESEIPLPETVQYFNADEKDFDYILIGDSHARHFYSYIIKNKIKVASFALTGCFSSRNYYFNHNPGNCIDRYKMTIDFIKAHPNKKIIWSRSTSWDFKNLAHLRENGTTGNTIDEVKYFIDDIKETNSKLYLLGDTQGSKYIMYECLAKQNLPINKLINFHCNTYQKRIIKTADLALKHLSTEYAYVKFIDASNALCDNKRCKIIDNNIPIYIDNDHLSKHGADIVGHYIFEQIKNIK